MIVSVKLLGHLSALSADETARANLGYACDFTFPSHGAKKVALKGRHGTAHLTAGDRSVILSRPIECAHDIFVAYGQSGWIVSDHLRNIVAERQFQQIDTKFLADYVRTSGSVTDRTPFAGVRAVPPGTTVRIDPGGGFSVRKLAPPATRLTPDQIPPTLVKFLQSHRAGGAGYVIEFSGGLDSAGMLYTVLDANVERDAILAVTYCDPRADGSEDVSAAAELCRRLGVPHKKILIDDASIIGSFDHAAYKPARPSYWLLYSALQQQLLASCSQHANSAPILNGHGGDHIFGQEPSVSAVVEPVFRWPPQLMQARRRLRDLSEFSGQAYYPLVSQCLCDALARLSHLLRGYPLLRFTSGDSSGILTPKGYNDATTDRNRLTNIIADQDRYDDGRRHYLLMEATHQASAERLTDKSRATLYPYINIPLLSWAWHSNNSWSFNASFNRVAQREAFAQRYGEAFYRRRGKGAITGALQRMILADLENLSDLTLNGIAIRHGIVDACKVESDLKACAVGSQFLSGQTLMLITMELFYRKWVSDF